MIKLQFSEANRNKFPIGSFLLLGLFYFIGILTYKEGSLSNIGPDLFNLTIIERDIRIKYSLVPEFKWQWQIFTYGWIHFALVHYAYVGVLIFYYVQGLEKATSSRFIILSFAVLSTIWPIVMGILYFPLINLYPSTNDWILSQGTYLGSSVGVWGLIGLSATSGHKRRLYWFGIFVLLVIEFYLKIRENQDVTSNVTHILIFLTTWLFASMFIQIENNDQKVGGMKVSNKADILLASLVILHAIGMVFYFTHKLGIS
ncbi:MAG: hypothetical protein ACXAC2_23335 [Candidatus Kariarchaeaceae archaeon]|jgi:hypothetical protein